MLLGLLAWCGLYLAWMGASAALVLGGFAIARERGPAVRRFLVAGALAAAIGAPAALPFAARLRGEGHAFGAPPEAREPLWRLNPWRHADALGFFAPGKMDPGPALVREHPTYAGWTVLLLAASTGPGPAWIAVGASGLGSLGDTIAVAGVSRGANPAAPVLHALPLADRFKHHARLWLLGQLVLVALAARAARERPWMAAVIAAEIALISPARLPLPGTPSVTPAIYALLVELPEGPVVVRGAAGPGIPPQKVLYDQRAHGRRLLHDPNRPAPVEPVGGSVLVALGPTAAAEEEARRGPPDVRTTDGAAWWIPER